MKHFLDIAQLSTQEITKLVSRALAFKQGARPEQDYSNHCLANLFYENSTRTKVSFELAAKHLQIPVVNLDLDHSSENKGEIIEDTIRTLSAMGIDLFVIRHRQDKLPHELAQVLPDGVHLINAGDGMHAHPSQALLDLMTIVEHKDDLSSLKIAIVGNIRHSRVANSLQTLFSKMKIKELALVAPAIWQSPVASTANLYENLHEGLQDADVVICLRVQRERLTAEEGFDLHTFRKNFALTSETFTFAKPDALIMHPGPVNRGIEIDNDLIDGPNSVILKQVQNGVFMRMAIIERLL